MRYPNLRVSAALFESGRNLVVMRREVLAERFAKKQDQWQEQCHPAMPKQQPAGEPLRIAELQFEWGLDDPDGNTGNGRHSCYPNDANR